MPDWAWIYQRVRFSNTKLLNSCLLQGDQPLLMQFLEQNYFKPTYQYYRWIGPRSYHLYQLLEGPTLALRTFLNKGWLHRVVQDPSCQVSFYSVLHFVVIQKLP